MNRLLTLLIVAAAFVAQVPTQGATIFESGTLGQTGLSFADFGSAGGPSGSGVEEDVFSGVRFELSQPVRTSRVGGHFVVAPNSDTSFFGAIVRLDSFADLPDSEDLLTDDFLGMTTLEFPTTSTEVFGELELLLDPGVYALIFGSGLFATSGNGAAVLNNPDIGSPSYIAKVPGSGWIEVGSLPGPFMDYRLVVEGEIVPEPATYMLVLPAFVLPSCKKRL